MYPIDFPNRLDRPWSVGDILDEAVRLYRAHFGLFLAIVALPLLPVVLALMLSAFAPPLAPVAGTPDAASAGWLKALSGASAYYSASGIGALLNLLSLPLALVAAGGVAAAVVSFYVEATRPTAGASLRLAGRRALAIVGAYALMMVLLMVALVPFMLVAALATMVAVLAAGQGAVVPATVACVGLGLAVGLFATTRLSLATPAIVAEELGPWAGLKRSWALTRGYFGRTLVVAVAVLALSLVATSVPGLLVAGLVGFVGDSAALGALETALRWAVSIAVAPVSGIAVTLLYLDLRNRDEGLGVLLQARRLAPATEAAAPVPADRAA